MNYHPRRQQTEGFGDDLLKGTKAIAEFVYGDATKFRKIFYLAAHTRFPHFKIGNTICALKSEIRAWIYEQIERSKRGAKPLPPAKIVPAPASEVQVFPEDDPSDEDIPMDEDIWADDDDTPVDLANGS